MARAREIDRERWEVVDDPLLTSGEREYAHKEAERERRWAGTVFLTAPVALAYWTAYQVTPEAVRGRAPSKARAWAPRPAWRCCPWRATSPAW